jgi:hypothetical protein
MNRIKARVRNYIWFGEDGEQQYRRKVAWDSLILHKELGGLTLIDLELQIKALLAKLFIRGLFPLATPLKMLIFYRVNNLSPKRGRIWHGHIHFTLFATKVRGIGSDIWHGHWKAWINIRNQLLFQQPENPYTMGR